MGGESSIHMPKLLSLLSASPLKGSQTSDLANVADPPKNGQILSNHKLIICTTNCRQCWPVLSRRLDDTMPRSEHSDSRVAEAYRLHPYQLQEC